jgi:hypothetical protein
VLGAELVGDRRQELRLQPDQRDPGATLGSLAGERSADPARRR